MNRKLLKVYVFLLILSASTMTLLWQYHQLRNDLPVRDYPEIQKEGIIRLGICNEGTEETNAFYLELSRHLSNRSGMEIQLLFFQSMEECTNALTRQACDIVAPAISSDTLQHPSATWRLREESVLLRDSLNQWLNQIIKDGTFLTVKEKYFR